MAMCFSPPFRHIALSLSSRFAVSPHGGLVYGRSDPPVDLATLRPPIAPNIWRYEIVIFSQKGKNVTGVPVSVPDSRPLPPPLDANEFGEESLLARSIHHNPCHLFI